MKRLLNLLLFLPALLSSCERGSLELTDNSFKYKLEVSYDEKTAEYGLAISFLSGSKSGDFTLDYTIDGNRALCLLDSEGNTVKSGVVVNFREGNTLNYALPLLEAGEHSIETVLSSDIYSKQEGCRFMIDTVPFSIHAEVNTNRENPASVLLLSLQDGLQSRIYSIKVEIDGKEIELPQEASRIDFAKTPIYSLTLPTIRPGGHSLRVSLNDSFSVNDASLTFNEPVRFPSLDLTLAYNSASGNHELTISRNPYGIRVRAQSKLTVSGSVTYYESESNGWTYLDPWYYLTTATKTTGDEQTLDITSDGVFCLAMRDKAAEEMTSSYKFSAIWKASGNSEDWSYMVTGYEPRYYHITKEELLVSFDVEKVNGVRVELTNNIPGCTVSGIE